MARMCVILLSLVAGARALTVVGNATHGSQAGAGVGTAAELGASAGSLAAAAQPKNPFDPGAVGGPNLGNLDPGSAGAPTSPAITDALRESLAPAVRLVCQYSTGLGNTMAHIFVESLSKEPAAFCASLFAKPPEDTGPTEPNAIQKAIAQACQYFTGLGNTMVHMVVESHSTSPAAFCDMVLQR